MNPTDSEALTVFRAADILERAGAAADVVRLVRDTACTLYQEQVPNDK